VWLIACALGAPLAAPAAAEVPAGPRLTFIRGSVNAIDLVSADPTGGDQQPILSGDRHSRLLPSPISAPTWSGDGTRVAFTGLFRQDKTARFDLYEVAADGTGVSRIPRTAEGFEPVLSSDGRTLAFAREREWKERRSGRGQVTVFQGVSTWLVDLDSGTVRRVTPWKNGLEEYPSSFSPDGSTLLLTRNVGLRAARTTHRVLAMRLDGGGTRVIARGAGGAVYSPDGTRLALITIGKAKTVKTHSGSATFTPTELAVANADGSGLRELTHTKGFELEPSWDPSGQRIAYTQLPSAISEAAFLGFGDSIMEINADGSCRTKVLSGPRTIFFGATWQPGPGREAGPLAC
jgi:Tol biopolymer transport system component